MDKFMLIAYLLLICSCSYAGYTHIKIKGDEVNVPVAGMAVIRGKNVELEMCRVNSFAEKENGCLCLNYEDVQGICNDAEWK